MALPCPTQTLIGNAVRAAVGAVGEALGIAVGIAVLAGWPLKTAPGTLSVQDKEAMLPRSGDVTFRPPRTRGGDISRDRKGGFIDRNKNSWQWDPSKAEWDVQHPDGTHTNVNPAWQHNAWPELSCECRPRDDMYRRPHAPGRRDREVVDKRRRALEDGSRLRRYAASRLGPAFSHSSRGSRTQSISSAASRAPRAIAAATARAMLLVNGASSVRGSAAESPA